VKQLITIETVPISVRYSGTQPLSQAERAKPVERKEPQLVPPIPRRDVYEKSEEGISAENTYTAKQGCAANAFELEIVELPKVVVKYVGGPMYIPKSADPEYDETEE